MARSKPAADTFESAFAPRWTWRSAGFAAAVTLMLYLLLPYLERLSTPPKRTLAVREAGVIRLAPPPPPAPQPPLQRREEARPQPPFPELPEVRRQLAPLRAALDLEVAIGDVGGDFALPFAVAAADLTEQVRELVFAVADLDEPPRPLTRLDPIYPPQARQRKIEGSVVTEFVVRADGRVSDIQIVSAEPAGVFDGAALRAITRWRLTPGTKGGQPVATRVRQKVDFRLTGSVTEQK